MNNPRASITGAVRDCIYKKARDTADTFQVGSIYIAGEAGGALLQILIADKLGRIRFMQLACIIVTIGCAIQTGSVNLGMFLAGRVISGIAVGSVFALCRPAGPVTEGS